jgi:hypothetical protein
VDLRCYESLTVAHLFSVALASRALWCRHMNFIIMFYL